MATLTTPGWSLPYPDGAERVMDGDNAIGALAAAVDTALTSARSYSPAPYHTDGPASLNYPTANALVAVAAVTIAPTFIGQRFLVNALASFSANVPGSATLSARLVASGGAVGGAGDRRSDAVVAASGNRVTHHVSMMLVAASLGTITVTLNAMCTAAGVTLTPTAAAGSWWVEAAAI